MRSRQKPASHGSETRGVQVPRVAATQERIMPPSLPSPRRRAFGSLGIYCAAIFFALALLLTVPAQAKDPNGPVIGSAAPAFVLPNTAGQPVSLEAYRGRTVVLNFWAFWCDTWKAEMPSLKELAAEQDERGFQIVAVSVDGARKAEFDRCTSGSVPFPVLLDGGGRTSRRYAVHHVPTVVIVDPDGIVRFTAYGYPGNQIVLRELRKIASKPRSQI